VNAAGDRKPVPPGGTVDASTPDAVALKELQAYKAGELKMLQTRAEKWIAGLVAITGVLTTAVVLKGPESFTKLPVEAQTVVISLMAIGAVLLVIGIYQAYCGAFGDPFADDELARRADTHEVDGAWTAWTVARRGLATKARGHLKDAAKATIAATVVLGLALGVAWVTPPPKSDATVTCIRVDGETIKLEGAAPTVSEGALVIVECE
jgi:hypothetical protein